MDGPGVQERRLAPRNPYIGIAEQISTKIDRDLVAREPPPAPVVAAAPAPKSVVIAVTVRFALSAGALFVFDKSGSADMLPAGLRKLDEFAARVKQLTRMDRLSLTGSA